MKQNLILFLISAILFCFFGCQEGYDASLLNNMNELVITGKNVGNFEFDHMSIEMLTHLYNNEEFTGVPDIRLSQMFTQMNQQDSLVAVNEKRMTYVDMVSAGDYYAFSFIDLNSNFEVDANEPFDVWLNDMGNPKMIEVREESRWEILFEFEETYSK
jgi:hypothetical protein